MSEKFGGHDYCSAEDLFLLKLWPLAVAAENIFEEDDPVAYETNTKTGERTLRRNTIRAMVNSDIASGVLTCIKADDTLFVEPIEMRFFSIRHRLQIKEKYDDYACLLYNPKQLSNGAFEKARVITTPASDEHDRALPESAGEQPDAATNQLILNLGRFGDSDHCNILKSLNPETITSSTAILKALKRRSVSVSQNLVKIKAKELAEAGYSEMTPRGSRLSERGVKLIQNMKRRESKPPANM